ncbi:MAG: GAF domain-containing protein, partial [Myxococcales bacterium]|nr:GAF domain-containing protein [Myxococcales bacterium]
AIDAALEVLAMLGVTLATAPPADLPTDEELVALPEMTDPNRLAAMRILTAAMPAAYIADPALLPSIAFTMVEQLIARGNSKFSAYACAFFGLIQCGVLGDIDTGYRFGKLSLRLLETHDATELESKVYALFYIFVVHWKEHVRDAIDGLLHGVRVGLETGDIEYAGYNAIHYCTFPLFYGADLEWLGGEMARYEELSRKLDQQYQLYYIRMWRQLLLGLRTEGCDGEHLAGSCFDERTMLANLGENQTSKFTLHQAKAMLLYAFGHHRRALESLREAAVFKDAVSGFVSPVEHNLYLSLALLSVYEQLPPSEQAQALQTVDHNQAQLAGWAAHAPQNNAHKHDLVEAERARATGDPLRALGLYERAIAGARTHGYLNEEALGYERMGELLLALGHQELGLHQLQAARRLYERWGARAKCDDLTRKHPRLRETAAPIPRRATPSGPTGASSQALDLISVVKASQAVASEIVLGRLLEKMMRIIIENAGATGGALLLVRDEDASLAAVGTTTEVSVFDGSSVDPGQYTPMSLVNLVMRTRQSVVINDASQDMAFAKDPYLARAQPKSILCIPLVHGESLVGVFYMEHRMAVGAFTPTRLEVLGLLSTQVAISIENSQLYEQLEEYSHTLEAKVEARTQELQEKNLRLGDSLQRIKAMQEQIIAQEKLASLGSVTAGV